jgi:L-methionine (R)-S-oxide reductase
MAETTLDVRHLRKPDAWAALQAQLDAILPGAHDDEARMATIACVLHHGFGFLWTGFYRVVAPRLLRVGAYQGTLGCLEIPFGRGVCGTAAAEGRTVVVVDVHAFPGHIACDARSASELVAPVWNHRRELIAVLDIDSSTPAAFDDDDAAAIERLVRVFAQPPVGSLALER